MSDNTIEAFPLCWPDYRLRGFAFRSRFEVGFASARDELLREIDRLGGKRVTISSNVKIRKDGLPYADQPEPRDRAIAVYFTYKDRQMCFACDKWDRVKDNMRAIAKTIEALRGIERWGSGEMVNQAFTGFLALESPKRRKWFEILGVAENSRPEVRISAYRAKAKITHPDCGGSQEAMAELNNAAIEAGIK